MRVRGAGEGEMGTATTTAASGNTTDAGTRQRFDGLFNCTNPRDPYIRRSCIVNHIVHSS